MIRGLDDAHRAVFDDQAVFDEQADGAWVDLVFLGQQALSYIAGVRRLDPVNPKLPALAGLHQQILKKYDKGPRPKRA